jgi:hypothetical protein
MLSVSRSTILPTHISDSARKAFLNELGRAFFDDDFAASIGRATSDVGQIRRRVAILDQLVKSNF